MSEPIGQDDDFDQDTKSKKTDLMAVSGGVLSNINFKLGFMLFFVSMLVYSDIFIDNVLGKGMQDATGCPTTSGTMTQITCVVLIYLVLDLLDKYAIL